jgi:hypothetical protein
MSNDKGLIVLIEDEPQMRRFLRITLLFPPGDRRRTRYWRWMPARPMFFINEPGVGYRLKMEVEKYD